MRPPRGGGYANDRQHGKPTVDDVFSVLANGRRRSILRYMVEEADDSVEVDDLHAYLVGSDPERGSTDPAAIITGSSNSTTATYRGWPMPASSSTTTGATPSDTSATRSLRSASPVVPSSNTRSSPPSPLPTPRVDSPGRTNSLPPEPGRHVPVPVRRLDQPVVGQVGE